MTITAAYLVFTTRYYRLIRAWVLHNEAHRKTIGSDAPVILIAFADFVGQYEELDD